MMPPWDTARRIHENARLFTLCHENPINYDPIKVFLNTSLSLLKALYEADIVELTAEARISLWRLRSTVLYSLLTFDHPSLELGRLLEHTTRTLKIISGLEEQRESLLGSTHFLLANPYNPKRERVEQMLAQWSSELPRGTIGLVTPPARSSPLGWGENLLQMLQSINCQVGIVRSPSDFQAQVWSRILMPFGGAECRFLRHLLEGYRSPTLHIVAYTQERKAVFPKTMLPQPGARCDQRDEPPVFDDETSGKSEEEERLEREFWELRRRVAMLESGGDDTEDADAYLVAARLVLLGGDKMVYLATRKKELIGSATATSGDEDSFCYRPVTGIREGDYLVLRTGTSADLVRTISESMMTNDGHLDECKDALDWKPMLKEALSQVGTDEFVRCLGIRNVDVSPIQYVWAWTGDLVMRPGTLARFKAVIQVIADIGTYTSRMAASDFANARWHSMQIIENYHKRAGFRIRRALLSKLGDLLAQPGKTADEYHVNLDEEFPGAEISLFRVLDVDDRDSDVPAGRLGKLLRLEGDLWRG